jgi:molybdate transport system substrate-binding protein
MIRALSGGAVKSIVLPLAARWGEEVQFDFQPMGKLVKTLEGGATPDMLIVTEEILRQLGVPAGNAKKVARIGIGVAVREGAPVPDLSSAEAFKRAVLGAKSIICMDPAIGTSGKHVDEIFHRLGIKDQIRQKCRLGQGGYITEAVARGEIELGIHHIAEITPVKGARLAGPLPPELQVETVYVAVARTGAAGVTAFIDHLASHYS